MAAYFPPPMAFRGNEGFASLGLFFFYFAFYAFSALLLFVSRKDGFLFCKNCMDDVYCDISLSRSSCMAFCIHCREKEVSAAEFILIEMQCDARFLQFHWQGYTPAFVPQHALSPKIASEPVLTTVSSLMLFLRASCTRPCVSQASACISS